MDHREIQDLYAFNRWANARVLEAVARLSRDQLNRDLGNSFPSLRDTLVHVLSAEWIWLQRWQGTSPPAMLDPAEFPDLAAIRARWAAVEREQERFVDALAPGDLAREVSYVNTKGETWRYPLGRMMQHVVNHSSYHRGQVTTMLRQLGAEPAATDLLLFFDRAQRR